MLDISHRTITLRLRFLIALEKMLLVREDGWHFLLPGASGRGCDFGGKVTAECLRQGTPVG